MAKVRRDYLLLVALLLGVLATGIAQDINEDEYWDDDDEWDGPVDPEDEILDPEDDGNGNPPEGAKGWGWGRRRRRSCEATGCSNGGTCNTGSRRCSCTSQWIGSTCDKCNPNDSPCMNKGICRWNGRCRCKKPWRGQDCSKCYCINGGTVANATTCECSCADGWTGNNCLECTKDDVCDENQMCNTDNGRCHCKGLFFPPRRCTRCGLMYGLECSNGGTAVTDNNKCECTCTAEWTGATCEKCNDDSVCQNGGTCTNNKCVCAPGWKGYVCDQFQCGDSAACQNGGKCITKSNGWWFWGRVYKECECASGFTGEDCGTSV